MITWITTAGSLAIITERVTTEITISATSDVGPVSYSLIAGQLPRGLRLDRNVIKGSPTEVRKYTTSRFVIRASDGQDIEDRTFSISVDGSDVPEWITKEGFLNVGPGKAFFVLDNSYVDFHLEALDPDINAGDELEYYLSPMGGELPPGLYLTRDGFIRGFTDPVFAVEYLSNVTGAYDAMAYDIVPLDVTSAKTNGFDTFFYDSVTYDYTEASRTPRKLSRFYTFVVVVSDGFNEVKRLFRIWVVNEEFLTADNNIIQVDTTLFQADSAKERVPLWITESNLGRYRADNYITIYLDVYDPPDLAGTITYFLLNQNPDGSESVIPPGMVLDTVTGEIAGRVPYQRAITKRYQFTMTAVNFSAQLENINYTLVGNWSPTINYRINEAVRFKGLIYICIQAHRNIIPVEGPFWNLGVAAAEKTFFVDIIGEIESSIEWISDEDRGVIKPNQPSKLFVEAKSFLFGGKVVYEFAGGRLPPGLELISTGIIKGKVKQFADSAGPGLTRFFERDSSMEDSTGTFDFSNSFDGGNTTFDRQFKFKVKARDTANFAENIKDFFITVSSDTVKTFANLYFKAFQTKEKRLEWYSFITDTDIFRIPEIYRYGDPNFGIQSELKALVYAGIESVEAVKYVQAMSRNHYRKTLRFGDVKSAVAKDPETQNPVYEVVYVEIVDELEQNGKSISPVIELSNTIKSKVLVSYDAIKVDSDIPFASDADHQRVFPNSFRNMRNRIRDIGSNDREFLPLWMRSIQDDSFVETGYVKALPLCYLNPGNSAAVISRIKSSEFDFKRLNFTVDRYLIDILNGQIENKYLAFPQRGEKLP